MTTASSGSGIDSSSARAGGRPATTRCFIAVIRACALEDGAPRSPVSIS